MVNHGALTKVYLESYADLAIHEETRILQSAGGNNPWFHAGFIRFHPKKSAKNQCQDNDGWKWLEMVGMIRFFGSTVDSLARSPTFRGRNVSPLLGMSGCFQASWHQNSACLNIWHHQNLTVNHHFLIEIADLGVKGVNPFSDTFIYHIVEYTFPYIPYHLPI